MSEQIYAASFFAIPTFRWFLLRRNNAEIEKRNSAREQRARALELPDLSLRRKVDSRTQLIVYNLLYFLYNYLLIGFISVLVLQFIKWMFLYLLQDHADMSACIHSHKVGLQHEPILLCRFGWAPKGLWAMPALEILGL